VEEFSLALCSQLLLGLDCWQGGNCKWPGCGAAQACGACFSLHAGVLKVLAVVSTPDCCDTHNCRLKEIAEVNEKQNLKEEAITFYDQAADLFETDGSTSEATKCRLKIAEFSAELGKYPRAVELFEEAAKRAVENNLLKFSARGYLLQAGVSSYGRLIVLRECPYNGMLARIASMALALLMFMSTSQTR
jgi:tetratricopeptide (TPR) repeat protein